MKWRIVAVDTVVTLALVLGLLVGVLVLGGCQARAPALALECEAGANERFGLWCSKHQLPLSGSTPNPETSPEPPPLPERQNFKARYR